MDCTARTKEGEPILVDGSNVAYAERTENGKPKITNLINACCQLREKGYRPIIIVDAALRYEIDDQGKFDELAKHSAIHQAPADAEADWFVLVTAEKHNAKIVSNDLFRPYQKQFPWIDERRVPLMIIDDNVEFYKLPPASSSQV